MDCQSAPDPPPLPPPSAKVKQNQLRLNSTVSPFIRKLQAAPEGYWFEPEVRPPHIDPFAPRLGTYFFYGTLMDPPLLREILALPEDPIMRPAEIMGYSLKLWGQYPSLINGPTGNMVYGMALDIQDSRHAARLAEYETKAYQPDPCLIRFSDNAGETISGTTFLYVGNPTDLSEGRFDLEVWLRRMGRGRQNTSL